MRSHQLEGPRDGDRFQCRACGKVYQCREHEVPFETCNANDDDVPAAIPLPEAEATLHEVAAFAEAINDSPAVMAVFAAPEWDCLSEDGQQWVCALIRETLRHAHASAKPKAYQA